MNDRERAEAQQVIEAVNDAGSELRVVDGQLKVRGFADLHSDLQRAVRECREAITNLLTGDLAERRERAVDARRADAVATFRDWSESGVLDGITEPIVYKPGHTIIDLARCVDGFLREAESDNEPLAALASHHLAEMLPAVRSVVERDETDERRAA